MDRGAVGVAGGLGDVACVETHPHREGHVGVGLVVLLDRPLDGDCGADRLVGRGEQGHEPVSEGFGLHRTGDLQPGADQVVVEADDLVGDGVTDPDPEVGGAFQIREQDREGALACHCLRVAHSLATIPVAGVVGAVERGGIMRGE